MNTFVLSTTNWVKVLIRLGTILFIAAVPGSFFAYYLDGTYSTSGFFLMSSVASVFGYFGYRGFILSRYLNYEASISNGQVHISGNDAFETFSLMDVEIRFEDGVEILSIFKNDGSLAFCIDYIGQDIKALKEAVKP